MRSCGVIVEYNPFHNGHRYHLEMARKVSQADIVVAVMSGNFLQRGEPAIVDKWERTKVALENGADLVVELPFGSAVQSADYFAAGAIRLLQELGVDSLCFGTDQESTIDYYSFGRHHVENEAKINRMYQEKKKSGESYAQMMTAIYQELFPTWPLDFSSPNHILGMSYAKENARYPRPMTLYPITRKGGAYHDALLHDSSFSSATAIRQSLDNLEWENIRQVVPIDTLDSLIQEERLDWSKFWQPLKFTILSKSPEELRHVYQMVEGIEYRLKEAVIGSTDFTTFLNKVKTKRYTWVRLQRLCLYVLLNITDQEIQAYRENPYLRVLGFNQQGQMFLRQQKKESSIPLVTNINKKNEALLSLDIKVGQLYEAVKEESQQQDYYRSPVRS